MLVVDTEAKLSIQTITIRANAISGEDVEIDAIVGLEPMHGKRVKVSFVANEEARRALVNLLAAQGFDARVK